jgi:serine/threonine protein kinase
MTNPESGVPTSGHDLSTILHVTGEQSAVPAGSTQALLQRRFGEYELLAEIARGGMGVVFKARQNDLNRTVALKMILAGPLAGEEEVLRFHNEAKAAAQLRHPNIVSIYEVGEHEGLHFFSMEYVPGGNLAQRLATGVLPGRTAARYIEQVARGLHYAHTKGVLHRDLKPANILLDEHDQPKLTDFGLAKMQGTAPAGGPNTLTQTGSIMGTPSYMAPEQAAGDTKAIGPASDVYSLGAVLYELITGRPPFKGESTMETVLQVLNQDPVPPRLLNRNVDADLEAICLKCLEKDPALRYASAQELADDLHRYLQGESVTAASINILERLTRTLTSSQHDKELRTWGVGVMLFGLVIFATHATSTFLLLAELTEPYAIWGPNTVQFILLCVILWHWRPHSLLPTSAAERMIWAVWVGYLIAYWFARLTVDQFGLHHLAAGPLSLLLSGLAFFVMGCHVWGWSYMIGLAFMAAAPLLARYHTSPWTPFWFGVAWGIALLIIGLRFYRIGQSAER